MIFHTAKHNARKALFNTRAAAWLCALPLALGLNLTAGAAQAAAEQTAESSTETRTEKLPEVRVGELSFKVTSLLISRGKPYEGHIWATLALTIANHGKEPIALNYKGGSASFVNEHGYAWRERHDLSGRKISGLPTETNREASVDYIIDPAGQLSVTIPLFLELTPNQSTGTSFNFQAVFSSFKDMGEGRLKKVRSYPVSFLGLKKSSLPEAATQSIKNGSNNIELNLKDALGHFFRK